MKKKTIFVLLTIYQGFHSYRVQLLSATLTYYTLVAVVPIIALLISLAETFHVSALVETIISRIFQEQKEVSAYLVTFAQNAVNEASKISFKIVGIILLFWAAIKMLLFIDVGINQLWENPPKPKFLKRKLRFAIILGSTFSLFFIVTSWNFFLTIAINYILKQGIFKEVAQWLVVVSNLLPSFLHFFLLSFLYFYVPYVKVRISSALLSGLITSFGYQIFQALYFTVQIILSKYNTVYGTFAALPLFFVWVHLSWLIFFTGAKLCYALEKHTGQHHY